MSTQQNQEPKNRKTNSQKPFRLCSMEENEIRFTQITIKEYLKLKTCA
jgi:hypothetical protein